jgi:hypothetical protein
MGLLANSRKDQGLAHEGFFNRALGFTATLWFKGEHATSFI